MSGNAESKLSVVLENRLNELRRLPGILEGFGKANGLTGMTLQSLNLVLEELLTNTISYGYNDDCRHEIFLTLTFEWGTIEIVIEDDGVPFNPTEAPDPDIHLSVEDRPVGGLGVFLVKQIMDELDYTRQESRNHLVMRKAV